MEPIQLRLVNRSAPEFLYQQVIDFIESQSDSGAIRPGDKLPSLRKLSQQFGISVPTVKQAYVELERQGAVSARPQSGYYLNAKNARTLLPMRAKWAQCQPVEVSCRSIIEQVYDAMHVPDTVALGISNPVNAHPPDKALARLMRSVLSRTAEKAVSYGPVNGDEKLRLSLALRYQEHGVSVNHHDMVVTNGAQEALSIALQCVAKKGDIIAVESPCYFGLIELIESLEMKALEVYTCTEDGVCIDELEKLLDQHPVKACLFSTAINNPLGSFMPEKKRQQLVKMLESKNIPLIEDDVYSDLYLNEKRPVPAQLFSDKGLVMTCSSFSKTAAPGYRVGWLIPGKFEEAAKRIKRAQSCSTSMLQQWTLTDYLLSGDYDRHLNVLRKILRYNRERMIDLIAKHFPEATRISNPQGGSVLWVRCRSIVDTSEVFQQAIEQGVSFAPGQIFSPSGKYKHYMRISFGVKWHEDIELAIAKLGKLVSRYTRNC
ncbi:PLP-dependent aminotransferase family protein [Thalassotalea sp. 1_MG-2023]|uniref:aminotransferase-like domain-containing protein n=1 Tax=Thalassotalea sp. 1_MG-2023 TaxID=3062680 RepID=UPI0026E1A02F|nr:PLP-dependent aminotransferase family protein [Thalassotalea sp. 1_MG-2023]MDO6425768.1 PLP-dependent aminotransferase family protein [Thalassotalea sp. 1_MG-2023]